MLRLALVCLTLSCAGILAAQSSDTLNGSVPSDRRLTYLYDVDFGGTLQSWTLNVSLQTGASSGLLISLIDVDGFASSAQTSPTSIDSASVTAPGTAVVTLNGSYSGVHCFAIEIETAQGTTASDYDGSITTSAGAISFDKQDQFVKSAGGLKLAVGKFAFWSGSVPSGSTRANSLELDFGSSSQTVFLRFEGTGTNIQKIEFIDTTGGTGTILATFTNPGTGDVAAVPMTHSGKASLRINVQAQVGATGNANWVVNAPCGVDLGLVGVPDGDGGDNDACSTGENTGGLLVLLGALTALAVVTRLRSARATAQANQE
ncbi:MAG: hypothetical protein K8I27_07295 [Planctomycetes bacterium]|nr:hypothetical protein [Planctomycetota bacterium]